MLRDQQQQMELQVTEKTETPILLYHISVTTVNLYQRLIRNHSLPLLRNSFRVQLFHGTKYPGPLIQLLIAMTTKKYHIKKILSKRAEIIRNKIMARAFCDMFMNENGIAAEQCQEDN